MLTPQTHARDLPAIHPVMPAQGSRVHPQPEGLNLVLPTQGNTRIPHPTPKSTPWHPFTRPVAGTGSSRSTALLLSPECIRSPSQPFYRATQGPQTTAPTAGTGRHPLDISPFFFPQSQASLEPCFWQPGWDRSRSGSSPALQSCTGATRGSLCPH